MIISWIVKCDNCGDKIDAKSNYYYTENSTNKHFCQHCVDEHPNEIGKCFNVMQLGAK